MAGPKIVEAEYSDEDADGALLLIGSEDDGRVYISVQDREPVILTPEQAEKAGRELLARARAGRRKASK
jgi:hypothetical protein